MIKTSVLRRSPLLFIFITVFVDLLGYGMVIPLLPFYVTRQSGGAAVAGALGSAYALMQLLSGPVIGALSDAYGRRPVLLVCLLGTACAYLLLGLANSLPMIFVAVMVDGITGGNLTTAQAYIADVTAPEERARGLGLVGAACGSGGTACETASSSPTWACAPCSFRAYCSGGCSPALAKRGLPSAVWR
jgi:DHA1 family tetracycline resistance protein-like MFS transporter